ncbi:MAG: hypothetical protein WC604_04485 [Candidatus Gracilibacteria bacterium]
MAETCRGMDAVAFQDGDHIGMTLRPSVDGREISATRDECPRRVAGEKGDMWGPYCQATHVKFSPDVADGDSQFDEKLRDTLRRGGPRVLGWQCLPDDVFDREGSEAGRQGAVRVLSPGGLGDSGVNTRACQATCHHFCTIVRAAVLEASKEITGKD